MDGLDGFRFLLQDKSRSYYQGLREAPLLQAYIWHNELIAASQTDLTDEVATRPVRSQPVDEILAYASRLEDPCRNLARH